MIGGMKILTAAEMGEVDRLTTERYQVPGILLMENAAARAAEAILDQVGDPSTLRALVICGRGNNGGDGAALARQLYFKGASALILLLGRVEEARGDARINFEIARAIATSAGADFRLVEVESAEQLKEQARPDAHNIYIDAIFGTGLTRPASGLFEEAINLLNLCREKHTVVAIDIPSGISSDSAELIGPAVRAHMTVSFTAPKIGNIFPPASDYNGRLVIGAIGSPDELIESSGSRLTLVESGRVARWLESSRRTSYANKGDSGKVLVVAGSRGKTGAACLAGEAALRSGTGLVTIATAESAQPVIAAQSIPECMTEPLPETAAGSIAREAVDRVVELASERDVVAVGPGLGLDDSTRTFVRALAMNRARPMIIDADGLNALSPWAENLRGATDLPLIVTPHPGEMARLIGKPVTHVVRNRIDVAREFATAHNVIVVLKGSRTLTVAPDGEVYVNPTGNAGMATGGTGDVLTGIIAALIAQKPDDPPGATLAAVYLHGMAGDIAASKLGTRAMIASDITAHLGDAFIETGGDEERLIR